jgi:hypothetical protein
MMNTDFAEVAYAPGEFATLPETHSDQQIQRQTKA